MPFLPPVEWNFTFIKTEGPNPTTFVAVHKKTHYITFLHSHSCVCVQFFGCNLSKFRLPNIPAGLVWIQCILALLQFL